MKSLAISLFALCVVGVNSHFFSLSAHRMSYPSRYPKVNYPQPQQPNYPNTGNGKIELVEGTLDQLNNIDAKWVCTNQKTGDMMVIGTENGNTLNNAFPPRNQQGQWQQPNFNGQRPQQPNFNPQQPNFNEQRPQQPNFNPQQPHGPNFNPQQPQQPNFNPQQPQQPNFNPQQPQQPNFNPQQPQQPNFNPQQPQQPNFNPQQPQQPNFNPQQPQQPNFNPQQPQQPNFNPQQPQQPNLNPQQPQQPNLNPPQQPQQPTQPQQPQNPGFVEVPWTAFPNQTPAPSDPLQGTTQDPLKDFDWASYVSTTPSSRLEYDGTGVIEPRVRL